MKSGKFQIGNFENVFKDAKNKIPTNLMNKKITSASISDFYHSTLNLYEPSINLSSAVESTNTSTYMSSYVAAIKSQVNKNKTTKYISVYVFLY